MSLVKITESAVSIEATRTRLEWRRESEEWLLKIYGKTSGQWTALACESSRTGYRAFLFGPVSWRERVYRIPAGATPKSVKNKKLIWSWTQEIGGNQVGMESHFEIGPEECIRGTVKWTLTQDCPRPHFGYGVALKKKEDISNYCWLYSPSQMGFFDRESGLTLWILSTHDREAGIDKFNGCQALATKMPAPDVLECAVGLPPGYTDFESKNLLRAGESVTLHIAFLASQGTYYDTFDQVLRIQPLEALAPRYSYRKHVDLVITALRDPKKWHDEWEGIIHYGVVRGNPRLKFFAIDEDREGPGWSGCWDLEMIYALNQYRDRFANVETARFIETHSKRMLHGWIKNPRFRIGTDLSWREAGDMRDAAVAAARVQGPVKQEDERDIIWTCHNAYMIYYLSKLTTLTEDPEYVENAVEIAQWFFRMQENNGSVPALWVFEHGKARVIRDYQAGSCIFMVSALLELYSTTKDQEYKRSALRLAEYAYSSLIEAVPDWGQGELDWLYYDAHAIDPTGVAYIMWGYADAYELTGDERFRRLVDKFASIMLCLFALWDPREEFLRGSDKVTMGAHGMDLKIAGGITHGNWPNRYGHLLMNRNELGDGLLRAYEVTGNETYRDFLIAYVNWHTYFQFTREVAEEPVSTLGSCPQNHPWTTSTPNYNNDWGCTASKMASLIMKLIERGIIED